MLTIAGIDHVVLRVRDIDAALAFYRDVLGCPVDKHNEPLGLYHLRAGDSLIDLVTLDGKLGLAGGAGPGVEGRNVDHICLRLRDYDPDATVAHLNACGVAHEAPVERYGAGGDARSIYLKDPDGNGIELRG